MKKSLPFLNWSLKKAHEAEPDSFARARINIIFTALLFSILKILVVIGIGVAHEQWRQVTRAGISLVLYVSILKVLLSWPSRINLLTHIMLLFGLAIVFTNIFVFTHSVNVLTVQFIFMAMLSSFYALGLRAGIIYSSLSILPVLVFFLFRGNAIFLTSAPQQLASPGFEIIMMLNFITIGICHYLFAKAYDVNIREKEVLNQELQLSVAEANKLAAAKSNFLSTVSHELRTPLNAVIGITELLIDDKPEDRQKENLKVLHGSAIDLLGLINNVLDFSKLDAGKLTLEAIPFSLREFMQNICAALRIKANEKSLDLVLDIDSSLQHTLIISDPTRLAQVMYNLIGNAVKFTDKGSVTVKLTCANSSEYGVDVLFSVKDTGPGIPFGKHEAIFELFTQAASDTARRFGGTGLGLPIVKQVLGLFDSAIKLQSGPGEGTRFYFTISFGIATHIGQATSADAAPKADMSHLKILVAEDIEINRMILKKQLSRLGLDAVIVEDGKQAYEACLSGNYDVLFIDLHMPVWGGYDAITHIRKLPDPVKANVPIVALTASITEDEKIMEAGFNSILYKPVQLNDIRTKLEEIVVGSTPLAVQQ